MKKRHSEAIEDNTSKEVFYKGYCAIISPNDILSEEKLESMWNDAKDYIKKKRESKVYIVLVLQLQLFMEISTRQKLLSIS